MTDKPSKKLTLKKETLRSLNQEVQGGISFVFSLGDYGPNIIVSDGGNSNSSQVSVVATVVTISIVVGSFLSPQLTPALPATATVEESGIVVTAGEATMTTWTGTALN